MSSQTERRSRRVGASEVSQAIHPKVGTMASVSSRYPSLGSGATRLAAVAAAMSDARNSRSVASSDMRARRRAPRAAWTPNAAAAMATVSANSSGG